MLVIFYIDALWNTKLKLFCTSIERKAYDGNLIHFPGHERPLTETCSCALPHSWSRGRPRNGTQLNAGGNINVLFWRMKNIVSII